MNRNEFEGNWHHLKGKIREKWGKFTNDDISRMNGKYEQFLGNLQKKYGYRREEAEREIKNWHHQTHEKSDYSNREERHNWSEKRPGELSRDDEELAHEDRDAIYPLDSGREERSKNRGSDWDREDKSKNRGSQHSGFWKSEEKNIHKKKDDQHGNKDKKRKAG